MSQKHRLDLQIEVRFRVTPARWTVYWKPPFLAEWHRVQPGKPRYLDPWEVRRQFLELPRDDHAQALEKFLEQTGAFDLKLSPGRPLNLDEIWEIQTFLRKRLVSRRKVRGRRSPRLEPLRFYPIEKHPLLLQGFNVKFNWEDRTPYLETEVRDTLSALILTAHLDLVKGSRFRYCTRKDCPRQVFEVTSKHARKYCGYKCAHLEVVRRSRSRKKEG